MNWKAITSVISFLSFLIFMITIFLLIINKIKQKRKPKSLALERKNQSRITKITALASFLIFVAGLIFYTSYFSSQE